MKYQNFMATIYVFITDSWCFQRSIYCEVWYNWTSINDGGGGAKENFN